MAGLLPRGPVLNVEWRNRRATIVISFEGEEAQDVLNAFGNDLPEHAKRLILDLARGEPVGEPIVHHRERRSM